MINQLSHRNLLPDLSKVTLRRVFKTDQVGSWKLAAKTLLSVLAANASRARAIAGIGALCETFLSQGTQVILRSSGCTCVAGVAGTLCASGEYSLNLGKRLAA
jgi:hypothetical protein